MNTKFSASIKLIFYTLYVGCIIALIMVSCGGAFCFYNESLSLQVITHVGEYEVTTERCTLFSSLLLGGKERKKNDLKQICVFKFLRKRNEKKMKEEEREFLIHSISLQLNKIDD